MSDLVKQDSGVLAQIRHKLGAAHAHFEAALPSTVARYLTPERLTKVALSAIGRNERLLECTPESILRSVMDAASLGLEPSGGALGHAYMVPYRNRKLNGRFEAQLIIGYRGFIELARRSGDVATVQAHVVHHNDEFAVELGSKPKIVHRPRLIGERGAPVAVYCIATLRDGAQQREVMTIDEVEKVRERSKNPDGIWRTDYNEMVRKTVVRRAAKYWPLSAELAKAFDVEDSSDAGQAVTVTSAQPALPAAPTEGTFNLGPQAKPVVRAESKPKPKPKAKPKSTKKAPPPEPAAEQKPAIPEPETETPEAVKPTAEVAPPAMSATGEELLEGVATIETPSEFDSMVATMGSAPINDVEKAIIKDAMRNKWVELRARSEGKAGAAGRRRAGPSPHTVRRRTSHNRQSRGRWYSAPPAPFRAHRPGIRLACDRRLTVLGSHGPSWGRYSWHNTCKAL
jgi:recombination protein RecT